MNIGIYRLNHPRGHFSGNQTKQYFYLFNSQSLFTNCFSLCQRLWHLKCYIFLISWFVYIICQNATSNFPFQKSISAFLTYIQNLSFLKTIFLAVSFKYNLLHTKYKTIWSGMFGIEVRCWQSVFFSKGPICKCTAFSQEGPVTTDASCLVIYVFSVPVSTGCQSPSKASWARNSQMALADLEDRRTEARKKSGKIKFTTMDPCDFIFFTEI